MALEKAKLIIAGENHTDAAFQAVKRNLGGIDSTARTLRNTFATLGVTISAGLFVRMIKDTVDAGDNFAKMSERVGVAASTLSEFAYAAKLSDVPLEAMETGIGALAKSMAYAGEGMQTYQRYFQQLNVDYKTSSGALRPVADVMGDVADRFSQMQNGSQKTALAMLLFQNAGRQMIPMLNQGREGLRQMRDEADRLGVVWSDKDAKAAQDLNNEMVRLNAQFDHFKLALANDVIPKLTELAHGFNEARAAGESLWDSFRSALTPDIEIAKRDLVEATEKKLELERTIAQFAAKTSYVGQQQDLAAWRKQLAVVEEKIKMAQAFIKFNEQGLNPPSAGKKGGSAKTPIEDTAAALDELASARARDVAILAKWSQEQEDAYNSAAALKAQMDKDVKSIDDRTLAMAKEVAYDAQLKQDREDQYNNAGALQAQLDKVFEKTDKGIDAAKELGLTFSSAFEDAIVQAQSLQDVIRGLAQDILRILVRKSVTEPLAAGLTNLFGGGKAAGGDVAGGVPILVGERGPELFLPRQSGSIVPNDRLAAAGGGVTVVNNIHFAATTPAALRDAMYAMLPTITSATKAAMIDAKTRGAIPVF